MPTKSLLVAMLTSWLAIEAATELRDRGTYGYWARTDIGRSAVREHFGG